MPIKDPMGLGPPGSPISDEQLNKITKMLIGMGATGPATPKGPPISSGEGTLEQLGKIGSKAGMLTHGPSGLAQPPLQLLEGADPAVSARVKMAISSLGRIEEYAKSLGAKDQFAEATQLKELLTRALMKKNVEPTFLSHLAERGDAEGRELLFKLSSMTKGTPK